MIFHLTRTKSIGWDETAELVIRANSEEEARRLANVRVGDEGRIWEDRNLTLCAEVNPDGPLEIICTDFHAG